MLEKRFFPFWRKVTDWTKLCIIRAIDHISFFLLSNINFFMFLLALKTFMALGAIWGNYGQFPYNKFFDVFSFPTLESYLGTLKLRIFLAINLINGPSCN